MAISLRTTIAVTILCNFLLLSSVSSSSSTNFPSSLSDPPKVSLGLYYESLCPYCANFIVNHLVKLFQDDLISIVDLHLSPWGNSKLHDDDAFTCQHGPLECRLDTVEACAINALPEVNDHFPFIYCVESLVHGRNYTRWETCFEKLGLNSKSILDCSNGKHGKQLELQYAAETNALQPPHRYVPWVVVDGQPLYEDYENFISYICKAYKGNPAPEACSKHSRNTIRKADMRHASPVCRKETTVSVLFKRFKSAVVSWFSKMNVAGLM